MTIVNHIKTVIEGEHLDSVAMREAMQAIMTGEATDAQIAGFLVALRLKGETVDELAAAAQVMRELATAVTVAPELQDKLVDTCGTGGDGSGLFNVSTASTLVVAEAGGYVAKHGNKSVSSSSGSADLLAAAGVKLDLSPERVAQCIEQQKVGFIFAPGFHAAMKHAIGPRRELGVRTLFNLLGPMTNPAGAKRQVIGVFDPAWLEPIANVLKQLGSQHVLVIHSDDGLDEISTATTTQVAELKAGEVTRYQVEPAELGIPVQPWQAACADSPESSLALVRSVLGGEAGVAADLVALNAGAAIYVSGLADDLPSGVHRAKQILASGAALTRLESLAAFSSQ